MIQTPVVFTLAQAATTDPNEQVMLISQNGGTPGTSYGVPTGTILYLTDFDVAAGGAPGGFKIQQDNGAGYFTIANLQLSGEGMAVSMIASPKTSWVIPGGPNVSFRVTVTTPDGPLPVACVISGYWET